MTEYHQANTTIHNHIIILDEELEVNIIYNYHTNDIYITSLLSNILLPLISNTSICNYICVLWFMSDFQYNLISLSFYSYGYLS